MEKDDEVKGGGNSYDFGARMYDARVGRWWSVDALASSYPYNSPYIFAGNTPTIFIDEDGNDFGIKVDFNRNSIIIVSNVYAIKGKCYRQAGKAANIWNKVSVKINGYNVNFDIRTIEVSEVTNEELFIVYGKSTFLKSNGELNTRQLEKKRSFENQKKLEALEIADPIGNSYFGTEHEKSKLITQSGSSDKTAAETLMGTEIYTNTHEILGDYGDIEMIVAHELGHTLGLDDAPTDKKPNKPYYSPDGIMKYKQINEIQGISTGDIINVLNYAKDKLKGNSSKNSKVTIISISGPSDGNNPLGISETESFDPPTEEKK